MNERELRLSLEAREFCNVFREIAEMSGGTLV